MLKKTIKATTPKTSNQIRITKNVQIDNILVALRYKYPLLDDAELIKILIGESGDKYLQMYNNLVKIADNDTGDNVDYSKLKNYSSNQFFQSK